MGKLVENKAPERVLKARSEWAKNDAKRDANLVEPEDVVKYKNISYGEYDVWNLLDVYRPANAEGKLPVIVSIHGGGYFYGDKELYRFYCMRLARFGFVVINFNYRLAPEYRYPAQLEDAAKVFGWMSQNAEEYGLDLQNVFITGDSAGSQLTSHFAAIYASKEYQKLYSFSIPNDIRVGAIGLACGLYELERRLQNGHDLQVINDYLGEEKSIKDIDLYPLKFIDSNYPATFVFSSYCDFLYSECEPMREFLESKGVEVVGKIYGTPEAKEIAHVFHVDLNLAEGEKANVDQTEFFKKHIV